MGGLNNETGVPDDLHVVHRYDWCFAAEQKLTKLLLWRDEKNSFVQSKIEEAEVFKADMGDLIIQLDSNQLKIGTYMNDT